MSIPTGSKEYQEWLDRALGGKKMCPECDGDLKDNHCPVAQASWLECDCGFSHAYEKG